MPSFDIVSEVEMNEVQNTVDNANRELQSRFDFRGADASYELKNGVIKLSADADFQIKQMMDILRDKAAKRKVDPTVFDSSADITQSGKKYFKEIKLKEGIPMDLAKKIVKMVKDSKIKVQTQIQGETIRVTGKKRDDLQEVIQLVRKNDLGQPFQFNNFRD